MLTKWEKYLFPLIYKNSYATKVKGKKIIMCDTWNLSSPHRQKDTKRYHCKSLEERRSLTRSAVLKVRSEYRKGFWDPFLYRCGEVFTKGYFHNNIKLLSFLLSFMRTQRTFTNMCTISQQNECRNTHENIAIFYQAGN